LHHATRGGRLAALLAPAALALGVSLAPAALASVETELAFHRGVVAYGEGQLDEAQKQFEIVLAADPQDTVALQYLGLVAQKRGDPAGALGLYDRALAIDPEDASIHVDRGIALMDLGRAPEAREAFARALELAPDDARAHLFAGIAAYRAGSYAEAKPHLDRAAALDPELRDEARYYTGLSDAFLGNAESAAVAFGQAAEQQPLSPLAQSAQNFRTQLETARQAERRWSALVTLGMEGDSNPLVLGDVPANVFSGEDESPDARGVIRLRGTYALLQREGAAITAGYDGYWGLNVRNPEIDIMTHNPWISGGYDIGPVRLGLRYDAAYSMIGSSPESFRMLNRGTPSVSLREGDWGVSQAFYQYHWQHFYVDTSDPAVYDRNGSRNAAGFNQFFFLPEPFTYVRVGGLGDWTRTDGTEWSYNGVEASFGAGYDFEYDISFGWLYHFAYRHYLDASAQSEPPFTENRDDFQHVLTFDLAKGFCEHWEASLGGAFTWNDSDVAFYDYDRYVGGVYLTYRF
jgi:tetratricopeptide (TPR) repeat protein